jgi:hypothetical protein
VSLAHDLVTDAAAVLDYESYVRQPDGSLLTQSTARDTILHMCCPTPAAAPGSSKLLTGR